MRRKAHNRLWTLIFTLLLCTASAVGTPRFVRADTSPTNDPTPPGGPPDPGAGDPDWPAGAGRTPKPGPTRGMNQPVGRRDVAVAQPSSFSVWMMKLRMAFAAGFRVFFRI